MTGFSISKTELARSVYEKLLSSKPVSPSITITIPEKSGGFCVITATTVWSEDSEETLLVTFTDISHQNTPAG